MEADNRKFTILSFIILSAIVSYIWFLILTQIVDWLKWGGSNVLFGYSWQVVGGVISGLTGLGLLMGLSLNQKATSFIDDVFAELRKTTWPNMRETSMSTVVVSIMVGAAALLFFVIDYFWGVFFRAIL